MNLILSSDFPITENEEIASLIMSHHKNPNIACVPPKLKEAQDRFPTIQDHFRRHGFTNLTLFPIHSEVGDTELDEFDVLFFTGGDPIVFRETIIHSNFTDRLNSFISDGKFIIASSGGSMQFTKNVSLFRLVTIEIHQVMNDWDMFKGLNIVDYEVLPHLNRFDSHFLGKVSHYSENQPHDVFTLTDGSAIIHTSRNDYWYSGNVSVFKSGSVAKVN